MSEKIKNFLKVMDLDDLQSAKNKLGDLEEEDIVLIRAVLKQWKNKQEVSNLLFYPSVIPEDIRISVLLKGLDDNENPYNILAATVGLQEIDPEQLLNDEITHIRSRLLNIIETNNTVLADRASVSILPFLNRQDVDRVFRLLSHPSVITRHNILSWLFETTFPKSKEEFIEIAAAHDISSEALSQVSKVLKIKEQRIAKGLPDVLNFPIYAYIPNRKEVIKVKCDC
jgi:hypothetical protein